MNFPPDARAGIMISPVKILVFLKGVFFRSLYHNFIFAPMGVQIGVVLVTVLLIGNFIYGKIKNGIKNNKLHFILTLAIFYILAYFPNFISADNFVAYRTMGTLILLSSTLLIISITSLSFGSWYKDALIFIVVVSLITAAHYNNKIFTSVQSKEYSAVKEVLKEKLKQGYPKKIMVIMPEENFLMKEKFVNNVVTDEFGKLSNSVDWAPKPFMLQEIYELTGNKPKAQTIAVTSYKRNEMPADSIVSQSDWVLDIEKIYLAASR